MIKFVVNISGRFHETKTGINLKLDAKLSDLAEEICDSSLNRFEDELNDSTHLYGFTESTYSFYSNNPKRAKYIKQAEVDADLCDNEKSCKDTLVLDVFNHTGKKMMFVYDFGSMIEIMVKRIS